MAPSIAMSDTDSSNHHQKGSDGTVTPGLESSLPLLGKQGESLINCNQKLKDLGIDKTIKLPQLCVVGDQSTGKSSLIEALSMVKVPKAKGCCTQCPVAINISGGVTDSSPWTCSVYIEEYYDYAEHLVSKGVTKNNPFGPWQKREVTRIVQVKTTSSKEEVTELIRASQSAILNPGSRPQDYLGEDSLKESGFQIAKFSPNVIRLDISQGGWPSLSFIDLPGVIANTGKDRDKYLIKLIRNLVKQYASADRSINMLTLPMTHDIENSRACALIQELKAEPHTLAVFTKADLADEDQCKQIFAKFMGSDDLDFRHGYHFVALMDTFEQVEARSLENDLFTGHPWSYLDKKHRERFGVEALYKYVRNLLFEKTREALPENLRSIEERLAKVRAELEALPKPPQGASLPMQLQKSVLQFENAMRFIFSVENCTNGVSARTAWIEECIDFKDTVTKTKPTVYLLTEDEEKRMEDAMVKFRSTQLKGAKATDAIDISSGEEVSQPIRVKTESSNKDKSDLNQRFRLDEIQKINRQHYTSSVPGDIEPGAVVQMNKLSTQHWDALLKDFMKLIRKLLSEQVNTHLETIFGQYRHLELFSIISNRVQSFVDEAVKRESVAAEAICRLEKHAPLTFERQELKRKESLCLKDRLRKRTKKRLELARIEAQVEGGEGRAKQKQKKDEKDLCPDEFETALEMSAKNRAYYEIASSRFVDTICMGIFNRLQPFCSESLAKDLGEHLKYDDPASYEQIISWMSEDPERELKRRQLLYEEKQLVEGMKYIQEELGANEHSPSKRRSNDSPEPSEEPKTPSKRIKTRHEDPEASLDGSTPSRLTTGIDTMELDD